MGEMDDGFENESEKPAEKPNESKPQLPEKVSDIDMLNWRLALASQNIVLAQSEKALAQAETAQISYKYFLLQLRVKYQLSSEDSFTNEGEIVRKKKE